MTRFAGSWIVAIVLCFLFVQPVGATVSSDAAEAMSLTFSERVACRETVEDILWSHQIWPEENPTPKPKRYEVMSRDQVAVKVESSLLYEAALLELWGEKLSTERVQRELDRIGRDTKRPEILLEIYAALENDPQLVAECFVRPQLAERLVKQRYVGMVQDSSSPDDPTSSKSAPGFGEWWRGVRPGLSHAIFESGPFTLPGVTKCRYCGDDDWTPAPNLPTYRMYGRSDHTTVWTGTEMIIWGGGNSPRLDTGGRYDPVTDRWTPISTTGAPAGRQGHQAVWTGAEMIVWGGIDNTPAAIDSGGRYNPATDSWTVTSTTGAPSERYNFTAVWTGSEMVVWGGSSGGRVNTGGRYDPATDSWTATTTTDAPSARYNHTMIWTGEEMIVWGGDDSGGRTDTGGHYDPSTDTWTPTSLPSAPDARYNHSVVWTGTEMIVWGGVAYGYATGGGRYNPASGTWTPMGTSGEPAGRQYASAVWTGTRMIIWGGGYNTGGIYDPGTNGWLPTSTTGAPSARSENSAVWTGSEMLIWAGGSNDDGARYDPATDSWTLMYQLPIPPDPASFTAVWIGTEMIIWGGAEAWVDTDHGYRYGLLTDSWTPISTIGAPSARRYHRAVWTGTEMIIVGGAADNSGGRYNPTTDTWVATSTVGAPSDATSPAAVWTGTEVLVWGGNYVNTGGKYNPTTDIWTATTTVNAPPGLTGFAYAWADGIFVVWGGQIPGQPGGTYANWGGRYNPTADMWFGTSTVGAPSARVGAMAVWTGSEMLIWGGYTAQVPDLYPKVGGRYDPYTDSWVTMGSTGAPDGRYVHVVEWTGEEMVVWSGEDNDGAMNTGGRYDPDTDFWMATNTVGAPTARSWAVSVWTGSEVLTMGPDFDGGIYCASGINDIMPPTNPTITGVNPGYAGWTSDNTVTTWWSGAIDDESGLAGYSVLMDQSASTVPDDTVEVLHVSGTNTVEMASADPDGDDWYFHLRTCDNAGNCAATAVHGGPFYFDTTAPSVPGTVASSSHDGGVPVSDDTIDVAWGASTDASSGVSRYAWGFTNSAAAPACSALVEFTTGTSATSFALADETWYLHVCAEDNAGLTSTVTTGGPYLVDTSAPTNPSTLISTSHTASVWSQTQVVAVLWSGASDPNGLTGYSVLFDTAGSTQPDAAIDIAHTVDPHSNSSTVLPEGNTHYFHLSTCDEAGNCSTAAHAGPYWIDVTAPGAPGAVSSPSHGGGVSADTTIDVAWGAATDSTSLIDGYSIAFTASPTWVCETTKDVEEGATTATSVPVTDGGWYFHVCAVDNAGIWGPVTSGGPYVVETGPPTVVHVGSVADSGDGVVTNGEVIDTLVTQLLLTFSEGMLDPAGHTTAGDVTNPTSYRLVGDGGDGTVATASCTVDPSDLTIAIDQVVYDAPSVTSGLRVNGGFALPEGSYALFACGSEGLGDNPGNPLDGDGDGTGGDDFEIAFSVSISSLLSNPNIDDDISGWTYDGPPTVSLTYGADSDASNWSGSLHLAGTVVAHDVMMVEQCLATPPSAAMRAGGLTRVSSGIPGEPEIGVTVTTFDAPGCLAGHELFSASADRIAGDTTESWIELPEALVHSEAAPSVLVSFRVSVDQGMALDVDFDTLELRIDPEVISIDDFEFGDMRNWSRTHQAP